MTALTTARRQPERRRPSPKESAIGEAVRRLADAVAEVETSTHREKAR